MKVLITGGAGFIGSNIVKKLLEDPRITLVRVLDNLSTGSKKNIEEYFESKKFEFIQGDIRNVICCYESCHSIDVICHQAALGSVPRSIENPLDTNDVNINGTLNIFDSARKHSIEKVIYAASSSTYGDSKILPKKEDQIGMPISPYAVTKYVNELYAHVYNKTYGIDFIGLRYFNVFGPKQSPNGPYAAVVPLFIDALLNGKRPIIHGDGTQARDFTYVENAVAANFLAIFSENKDASNQVYNVACGTQTTINDLFLTLRNIIGVELNPIYSEERKGDVKMSLADISKISKFLNYRPTVSVEKGLRKTIDWHLGVS